MVKTLLDLGADASFKNSKGLYASQAYADEYGMDESALLIERRIYFPKDKNPVNTIGSMFTLGDISSANSEQVRSMILASWRNYTEEKTSEEFFKKHLDIVSSKKRQILEKLEQVQNLQEFDPYKEYLATDGLHKSLKQKRLEVICTDLIESFKKYH